MKHFKWPALLTMALTLAICSGAKSRPAEETAVDVVRDFADAYNHKDIEDLVSLYAEDAIMVSEAGMAQGKEAIKARLSKGIQQGNAIAALHPEKSDSSGALSYTEGMADVINSGQRLQRHYLVVVKKVDSKQQIAIHYSLPNPEKAP